MDRALIQSQGRNRDPAGAPPHRSVLQRRSADIQPADPAREAVAAPPQPSLGAPPVVPIQPRPGSLPDVDFFQVRIRHDSPMTGAAAYTEGTGVSFGAKRGDTLPHQATATYASPDGVARNSGNPGLRLQRKLAVNKPGDEFEQEADRVADQVMRMPEPAVQRTCACGGECPKCQRKKSAPEPRPLQTKRVPSGTPGEFTAPPVVDEVLRSSGQPLDPATRAFMEPRFGHDFSGVRMHTGALAAESTRAVGAHAYTVGNHVVMGADCVAPHLGESRRLMAHELMHVVQQGRAEVRPDRGASGGFGAEEAKGSIDATRGGGGAPASHAAATDSHLLQRNGADKDPVCDKFDLKKAKEDAVFWGKWWKNEGRSDDKLNLIRSLKLIRRCATTADQAQMQTDLSGFLDAKEVTEVWNAAGTAFGGYTGMYPGYAPDIKKQLTGLGASETVAHDTFELTASGKKHRAGAAKAAKAGAASLSRTDIVYFRGHQFAQYQAPGLFSDGNEERGIDLRYIVKKGGFTNVKLVISTSCALLCKQAVAVFRSLFPSALILGYRRSAPLEGDKVRADFQKQVKALAKPLLLDQPTDISSLVSAWKTVVESRHAGQTGPQPGYYDGTVHYWDGKAWQAVAPDDAANVCKQKGDFKDQYPAP
jgi:hypothetical protein